MTLISGCFSLRATDSVIKDVNSKIYMTRADSWILVSRDVNSNIYTIRADSWILVSRGVNSKIYMTRADMWILVTRDVNSKIYTTRADSWILVSRDVNLKIYTTRADSWILVPATSVISIMLFYRFYYEFSTKWECRLAFIKASCQIGKFLSYFGHWYPCFRFLVTSPLVFKARMGCLIRVVETNGIYVCWDPPQVLHLPSSWWQIISTFQQR